MTLPELLLGLVLFSMVAAGIGATLIQMRKASEGNIGEATAQTIAGGIVEQIQFTGYTNLIASPSVTLKFVGISSANLSTIQDFALNFAPDGSSYTDVGEVSGGVTKGVVLDMDYIDGTTGNLVRPRRYMKMSVNLQRTIDSVNGNISILLSYQWEPPDRKGILIKRELRTLISQAGSY